MARIPTKAHAFAQARADYDADCAVRPLYHNGTPRPAWHELTDFQRATWVKPYMPNVNPNNCPAEG